MKSLEHYNAESGSLMPVFTLEIQTLSEYTDKLLDAVMQVYPLSYGRYERNASISAPGKETAQPQPDSTTSTHRDGFEIGSIETYPMVELKISIDRDLEILANVMDALIYNHHYEQPVIFIRQDWVSLSNYNPDSDNPNRWWNNKQGLPEKVN